MPMGTRLPIDPAKAMGRMGNARATAMVVSLPTMKREIRSPIVIVLLGAGQLVQNGVATTFTNLL